jgi:hypothetical protein
MRKLIYFSLLFLGLSLNSIYGDILDTNINKVESIKEADVFANPPTQFLSIVFGPGTSVSKLPLNTRSDILERKTIATLGRTDVWLKLRYRLSNGKEESGWVLYGTRDISDSFIIIR